MGDLSVTARIEDWFVLIGYTFKLKRRLVVFEFGKDQVDTCRDSIEIVSAAKPEANGTGPYACFRYRVLPIVKR